MNDPAVPINPGHSGPTTTGNLDPASILDALAMAIIAINADGIILQVNSAAEQLLKTGATNLMGHPLNQHIPADSPIFSLITQVQDGRSAVSEHGVNIETPRMGLKFVNVWVSNLSDQPECVVLSLQERSIADKIERHLNQRGSTQSVSAMAAMLAHEVKNPLSGIRGAAQLLDDGVSEEDRSLTRLIQDETDRICALVDRMEVFSDSRPLERNAVNIHQVIGRVRQIAESGFGRNVNFMEIYDPSLPPVLGNNDQLIQVFLNLVKNACEAAPEVGGEVILKTAYKHGFRLNVPGTTSRVHLPLMVSIQDNGGGIPENMKPILFEPFITSKPKGSGLGLPLVAKIIGDHGGVVECDSYPGRTVFRVMLPMATGTENTSVSNDLEPADTSEEGA